MKLLKISSLFITLLILSCDKELNIHESSEPNSLEYQSSAQVRSSPQTVKIVCSGGCNCTLVGTMQNGIPVVECSCGDCTMEVTYKTDGVLDSLVLVNSTFEVEFLNHFESHMSQTFPAFTYSISSIEIETFDNYYAYLYSFKLSNDDEGTVLFAKDIANNKKHKIDCTGTCDCRERFIATDPPTYECTCSDCTMTVEVIE